MIGNTHERIEINSFIYQYCHEMKVDKEGFFDYLFIV